MQSRINMSPSQIVSQPSQARTQVMDTVGNRIATPSLFGDLATGIQAVLPQAGAYADKQQKKFVEDAQKQGAEQQLENPLAEPTRQGQENPYAQDGRLEIWSKAKAADVSNRRQALTDEILQSNDLSRIKNAQSELDKFDQEELQGIAQVDTNVARQMFGPLMQQKNHADALIRNQAWQLTTEQRRQDFRTGVAQDAQDPAQAGVAIQKAISSLRTSGIPMEKGLSDLIETAAVARSQGNIALSEAILKGVDPVSKEPLQVVYQRYGLGSQYAQMANQVTQYGEHLAKETERRRTEASKELTDRFIIEVNEFEKLGGSWTAEEMAGRFKQLDHLHQSGLMTTSDRSRAVSAFSEVPKVKAATAELEHASRVFINGSNSPGGSYAALNQEVNSQRISEKTAYSLADQNISAKWDSFATETDPETRKLKMEALMVEMVETTKLRGYKSAFVSDVFNVLKTGQLFNPQGEVREDMKAHQAFLQQVLTDKSGRGHTIMASYVSEKADLKNLEFAALAVQTGFPLKDAMLQAQKMMTSPMSEEQLRRAMTRLTDTELEAALSKDDWGNFDNDAVFAQQGGQTSLGGLWDKQANDQAKNRLRNDYQTFRSQKLFSVPGMSEDAVLSAYKAKTRQSRIWDKTGDFVDMPEGGILKFNEAQRKAGRPEVDMPGFVSMLQRYSPELKKRIDKENPEQVSFELVQRADGELLLQPTLGNLTSGVEPIAVSQLYAIERNRILASAKRKSEQGPLVTVAEGSLGLVGMAPSILDLTNDVGKALGLGTIGKGVYSETKQALDKAIELVKPKEKVDVRKDTQAAAQTVRNFAPSPEQLKKVRPIGVSQQVQPLVNEMIRSGRPGSTIAATIMAQEGFTTGRDDVGSLSLGFGVRVVNQSDAEWRKVARDLNIGDSPQVIEKLKQGVIETNKSPENPKGKLTIQQAQTMLSTLLPKYEKQAIANLAKHPEFEGDLKKAEQGYAKLSENQRASLVALAYNAGGLLMDSQHKAYDLIKAGRPQDIKTLKWTSEGKQNMRPLEIAANIATDPMTFLTAQVGTKK